MRMVDKQYSAEPEATRVLAKVAQAAKCVAFTYSLSRQEHFVKKIELS